GFMFCICEDHQFWIPNQIQRSSPPSSPPPPFSLRRAASLATATFNLSHLHQRLTPLLSTSPWCPPLVDWRFFTDFPNPRGDPRFPFGTGMVEEKKFSTRIGAGMGISLGFGYRGRGYHSPAPHRTDAHHYRGGERGESVEGDKG
ncbi:hypothetical protein Drorol1_Dr00009993, partial [Drosera rotundifolia]